MKKLLFPFFKRIAQSLGVLEMQSRIDKMQSRIDGLQIQLNSSVNRSEQNLTVLERHLERRNQEFFDDLQSLGKELHQETQIATESSMRLATERIEHGSNEIREHLENKIIKTIRDLDNLRRAVPNTSGTTPNVENFSASVITPLDDSLYVSLEDHFRGDVELVRLRQFEYLPYIRDIVSTDFPLLDLGCGRGEWLRVLKENNIASRGVDSNISCINQCYEYGLDVTCDNLLSTLSKLPDASCGAITMFQVLEHLPFPLTVEVLRQSLRVLIPGGVFIGEIPNTETLRVGASTFWIDPTHERPLFPSVLAFLASTVGYAGVIGKYSSPMAPLPDLSGVPPNIEKAILDLHHAINGPGDFALIATA
jgi:O-antigen chain-terminating methyltransferase